MVRRCRLSSGRRVAQTLAVVLVAGIGLLQARAATAQDISSGQPTPGRIAAVFVPNLPAAGKPPGTTHATALAVKSPADNSNNSSVESTVTHPTAFGISPPLRELEGMPQTMWLGTNQGHSVRRLPRDPSQGGIDDRVEQRSFSLASPSYSVGADFVGLGNGFPNFSVTSAAPDANIAVGDTQIVEWVNSSYVVCAKAAPLTCGPAIAGNALWSALGGICAANNDGQGIVQWDVQAHRWLLAQNVLTGAYGVCVAISTTADATGSYFLYEYPALNNGFPDYQKWGVWSTGYFQTWNNFGPNGDAFVGSVLCAYNRTKLLVGDQTAEQICNQYTSEDFSLLPADIDSPTSPPNGQDEFAIGSLGMVDTSHLSVYSAHINNPNDWSQGAEFTGNNNSQLIAIAPFTSSCNGSLGGDCVPQEGVSDELSSLGDRLMYRFVYYNDSPGGQSAITATALTLFQQGTYAPDGVWRWMGSIARDQAGDILVGYSKACGNNCPGGAPTFPSIEIAGRLVNDPLGLGHLEAEVQVVAGTGSQTVSPWGSYTSMRIDPTDVCTFWYANEYYTSTTMLDWSTQIASIKFSDCFLDPDPAPQQHWYVNFDVTASGGQGGVRWMELLGGLPTGTNVISDPNPSTYFQPVMITAFVFPLQAGGTPTGTVDFADTFNSIVTPLCTAVTLGTQGLATCTTSVLATGTHDQIVATYSGDGTFAGSSGTDDPQVVNKATTVTTVSSLPNPSQFNELVDVKAVVAGQFGGVPTGTVSFTDNLTSLCPGGIQLDSTGTAVCPTQGLTVGSHSQIVANYGGDSNFIASAGTDPVQTVIKAVTSIQVTSIPNPSQLNQPVTITAVVAGSFGGGPPTGTVTFSSDNNTVCSAVQLGVGGIASCQVSTLTPGTHNIQACYSGDANFQPSCGQIIQTVNQATTTVNVTSTPNPSHFNQLVTISALVNGVPGLLPSGTVTFTDTFNGIQTTLCAGVRLRESGMAVCSTTVLACGTHSNLVASYSGDQNYLPSNGTDSPPQVVIGCGDFTVLPISPGSVQITQTDNNNNDPFFAQGINVTLQPLNGYNGTVSLSCSVSPPLTGGSCTVNSPTLGPFAGANLSTSLTISVGSSTPDGPYTVTVQAQDGSGLMHSATLALTVVYKSSPLTMVTGGAGPPTQVNFGPGPGTVTNLSCPLVTGTGINGSEDFGAIGGVCSFNPASTNLPAPVIVTLSGCTIAQLRMRTRIYASLWLGIPGLVLLGSFGKKSGRGKKALRILAILLPILILLVGIGCGGVGQTTPSGSYQVLVQGTGADGTVYSAVIPVTVTPLGQ
jgi:hypothetical protein